MKGPLDIVPVETWHIERSGGGDVKHVRDHVRMLREFAGDEVAEDAIEETVTDLHAQLAEARRVLKLVEWSHDDACPVCYRYEPSADLEGKGVKLGHAPDCALAKVT